MGEIGFTPIQLGGTGRMKPSSEVPKPSKKAGGPLQEAFRASSSSEPSFNTGAALGLEGLKNVRLHFKIDPDTHDISVAVIDQDTERIIRTIPPEQVRDMSSGSLVEVLT
ncbi:MAG: flagellar protein FlaG [Anaerolineales bacterium]|nr:flagellar protein FlaG [Anaerolineales bacterium]